MILGLVYNWEQEKEDDMATRMMSRTPWALDDMVQGALDERLDGREELDMPALPVAGMAPVAPVAMSVPVAPVAPVAPMAAGIGNPFGDAGGLTQAQREDALPYVEPSGPNAGTVLDPVPGAGTRNAMQLLAPQAERPGTVAFRPPGGGVAVVPQANVRGGGVYAPTDKGWIGQGQIPLGPAMAPVAPVAGMAPTVPAAAAAAATGRAPAYSAIAEAEAINRENSMRRRGIETAMAPGGIRSGPTSVWERNVAGAMRQQDAQAAAKAESDRAAGVRATNTQEKRAEQERELQNRIRVAEISNPPKVEKAPDVTERLKNLAPLFKSLTGTDVDPMVFMQVNMMKEGPEKKAMMDKLMSGADAQGKAAMMAVIRAGLSKMSSRSAMVVITSRYSSRILSCSRPVRRCSRSSRIACACSGERR
jgi:hypothetical protein